MDKITKPKILIVDDNVTNLNIARKSLCDDYNVVLIKDGAMALAEIANINPNLILLDVEMPGMNGFEVIDKIKNEMPEPFRNIPVIFLTAKDDGDSEFKGLNLGAVDYVIKPFSSVLLKKRVELHLKLHNYSTRLEHLVDEKTANLKDLQYAIIYSMAEMVERRDRGTGKHIMRTHLFLKHLLLQVIEDGIYKDSLKGVNVEIYAHASQMHDVGKIAIPDGILLKPAKLTADEYETIKKHTIYGSEIIDTAIKEVQDVEFLEVAKNFALTHHEKWNGTGYPRGLKGEEIPISGRLMAIVDAYDALISARPYKHAKTHQESVDIIIADSGSHFDPLIVNSFLKVANEFVTIADNNRDD